jgi:hypothetical protein
MHLLFGQTHVQLSSSSSYIQAWWTQFFTGWPRARSTSPDIVLHLDLSDKLPALPKSEPFFSDSQHYPGDKGILDVYHAGKDNVLLHFVDGAQIEVPLSSTTMKPMVANGVVVQDVFRNGRFLDITYTSLAPLFRRHGYFMIHAFAAVKNGSAILIAGPSGSGKTTTGLSLILAGWRLLSNDVLLIRPAATGVIACPTPDDVTIRPKSFVLLPELVKFVPNKTSLEQIVTLTGYDLTNGQWGQPSLVKAIYIPQIEAREESEARPLSRAVCLAHLMEESVDKWDTQTLSAHIDALQTLCRQAQTYTLHLGSNAGNLPDVVPAIPILTDAW